MNKKAPTPKIIMSSNYISPDHYKCKQYKKLQHNWQWQVRTALTVMLIKCYTWLQISFSQAQIQLKSVWVSTVGSGNSLKQLKKMRDALDRGEVEQVLAIQKQNDGRHFACKSKLIFYTFLMFKKYLKNSQ